MKKQLSHKTKGVFFDLYGTLLIYEDMKSAWSGWIKTFHAGFRRFGLSLPEETFAQQCDGFFSTQEPPEDNDGLTVFERRLHHLTRLLGLTIPDRDLGAIADGADGAWQQHLRLDPASRPTLGTLRSEKTLALISNFEHPRHVHGVLADYRLSEFFETIVVSGEVGVKKPDPEIFQLALDKTRLSPSEVLYIGDTVEDVEGAEAAGITPILIRRPEKETDPNSLDFRSVDSEFITKEGPGLPQSVMVIDDLREVIGLVST